MSALGQKRTLGISEQCPLYPQKQTLELSRLMSALCQKRTSGHSLNYLLGALLDHIVGLRKQRWWDRYAERLSRLEIDHQLVLGWRLHGKIGWLLAFEDAIDVNRGAPMLVDKINAIRDQSAVGDIKSVGNDRRKFVLSRKRVDQFASRNCQCAPRYNQTAIWLACKRSDGTFSLGRVAHIDWSHVHPE